MLKIRRSSLSNLITLPTTTLLLCTYVCLLLFQPLWPSDFSFKLLLHSFYSYFLQVEESKIHWWIVKACHYVIYFDLILRGISRILKEMSSRLQKLFSNRITNSLIFSWVPLQKIHIYIVDLSLEDHPLEETFFDSTTPAADDSLVQFTLYTTTQFSLISVPSVEEEPPSPPSRRRVYYCRSLHIPWLIVSVRSSDNCNAFTFPPMDQWKFYIWF